MPLVVSSLILSALHGKWLNWVWVCSSTTCLLCAANAGAQMVPRRQALSQAQIIDEISFKGWARRDPMAANMGSSSSAVLEVPQVWVHRAQLWLHWCVSTEGQQDRKWVRSQIPWSRLREDKRMKPQRWWPAHSFWSSFTTYFQKKTYSEKEFIIEITRFL